MSLFDKIKGWFGTNAPANDAAKPNVEAKDDTEPEHVPAPRASEAPSKAPRSSETPYRSAQPAGSSEPKPKRRTTPKEDARLEAEARTLFAGGDSSGGLSLLGKGGILFARREATTLPCLCKRCLLPDLDTAESAGVSYVRDFVVTRHHVFFYWMPAELSGDAKQVRASMRSEVRHRLRVRAAKADEPRQGVNPGSTPSRSSR